MSQREIKMKHRLMDLLACPLEKAWPLKLEILEEEIESEIIPIPEENQQTKVICNFYCNYKQYYLVNIDGENEEVKLLNEISKNVTLDDCQECFQIEILEGKLFCSKDESHSYDIKEGIPVMLTEEQIKQIYGKRFKKS